MKELKVSLGAIKIVEECALVKSGELALIVTDSDMLDIAKIIAIASRMKGAEVVISVMTPRRQHHEEPPSPIAEAMKKADVIFTPTTYSIAHAKATEDAMKLGVRVLLMTQYEEELLDSDALIKADFKKLSANAERLAELFVGADARITSPAGTDLKFSIKGRKPNILRGIFSGSGKMEAPPDVEVNWAPIEGTTNGRIVIDGAISTFGLVDKPIEMLVQDGFVVPASIRGGNWAQWLQENLKMANDSNAYNIGEIAFGLNPFARIGKYLIENEAVLGTGHIAVGSSAGGGTIHTTIHVDMIYNKPTLEVDERLLIDNGQILSSD